jgi:hypothetical protein
MKTGGAVRRNLLAMRSLLVPQGQNRLRNHDRTSAIDYVIVDIKD